MYSKKACISWKVLFFVISWMCFLLLMQCFLFLKLFSHELVITLMLFVRSFAAVYIQPIIAHKFFLGKSCFFYRLVSVRYFTIDSPRNSTLYKKFRYNNWWFVVRIWLKSRLTIALLRHSFKITLCTSNVSNFIVIILRVLIFLIISKFPYISVSSKNYPIPFCLLCHFPYKVELVF